MPEMRGNAVLSKRLVHGLQRSAHAPEPDALESATGWEKIPGHALSGVRLYRAIFGEP